ncbi:trichohyalin-like isoform X2 [Symsagittifera roscoffensis]|uniref:trichohyalin-like isoform X2 n=1 Tax=Symsagittifera roscoffensis TaxID=84072 RepID=UPI00307B51AE
MPGEQNDLSTCMSDEQLKKAYEALAEFFQFDNHEQGFPVSSEGDDLNIGELSPIDSEVILSGDLYCDAFPSDYPCGSGSGQIQSSEVLCEGELENAGSICSAIYDLQEEKQQQNEQMMRMYEWHNRQEEGVDLALQGCEMPDELPKTAQQRETTPDAKRKWPEQQRNATKQQKIQDEPINPQEFKYELRTKPKCDKVIDLQEQQVSEGQRTSSKLMESPEVLNFPKNIIVREQKNDGQTTKYPPSNSKRNKLQKNREEEDQTKLVKQQKFLDFKPSEQPQKKGQQKFIEKHQTWHCDQSLDEDQKLPEEPKEIPEKIQLGHRQKQARKPNPERQEVQLLTRLEKKLRKKQQKLSEQEAVQIQLHQETEQRVREQQLEEQRNLAEKQCLGKRQKLRKKQKIKQRRKLEEKQLKEQKKLLKLQKVQERQKLQEQKSLQKHEMFKGRQNMKGMLNLKPQLMFPDHLGAERKLGGTSKIEDHQKLRKNRSMLEQQSCEHVQQTEVEEWAISSPRKEGKMGKQDTEVDREEEEETECEELEDEDEDSVAKGVELRAMMLRYRDQLKREQGKEALRRMKVEVVILSSDSEEGEREQERDSEISATWQPTPVMRLFDRTIALLAASEMWTAHRQLRRVWRQSRG